MTPSIEKKMNMRPVFTWIVVTLSILFFLGACEQTREAKDETTLGSVALQYWTDRLVAPRNYQASYKREMGMTDPFETYRGLVSRNEKFKFLLPEISDVKIDGNHATLSVSFNVSIPNIPRNVPRTFKDIWIYEAGEWKHEFSKNQP